MRLAVITLITLPLFCLTLSAEEEVQHPELYRALELMQSKEWRQAADILEQLLETDDLSFHDSILARRYLGIAYSFLGKRIQAIGVFRRLLSDDPDISVDELCLPGEDSVSHEVMINFANVVGRRLVQDPYQELKEAESLQQEGRWEEAARRLEVLLDEGQLNHDDRVRALRTMGLALFFIGRKDEAIETYRELMEYHPEYFRRPDLLAKHLGFEGEELPESLAELIGQSTLEVIRKTTVLSQIVAERRLRHFTRHGAIARSVVLPGWGQKYLGYQRRGNLFLTLTMYSFASAALWKSDYTLGITVGLWSINVLDAMFSAPNIPNPYRK